MRLDGNGMIVGGSSLLEAAIGYRCEYPRKYVHLLSLISGSKRNATTDFQIQKCHF